MVPINCSEPLWLAYSLQKRPLSSASSVVNFSALCFLVRKCLFLRHFSCSYLNNAGDAHIFHPASMPNQYPCSSRVVLNRALHVLLKKQTESISAQNIFLTSLGEQTKALSSAAQCPYMSLKAERHFHLHHTHEMHLLNPLQFQRTGIRALMKSPPPQPNSNSTVHPHTLESNPFSRLILPSSLPSLTWSEIVPPSPADSSRHA